MKKIAYIFYYKFNKMKYAQYGLEYLNQFLEINVLDVSGSHEKQKTDDVYEEKINKIFFLKSAKEVRKTLINISPDYIVLDVPESFENEILEITRDLSFKSLKFYTSQTINVSEGLNLIPKIKYFIQLIFIHLDFKSFFYIFFEKIKLFIFSLINIFLKKKKVFYADKFFIAGDKAMPIKFKKNEKNFKVIHVHSLDYQNTLDYKFQSKENFNNGKNAVFLDQILLNHPDYKLVENFPCPVTNKYLHELKNFFNFIEKKFNYKIVIALHPRCNDNTLNLYENFFKLKCFRNKTMELVSNSNIVIAHPSTTALAYPIIFKKPLTFITTNELEKNYTKYVSFRITNNIIKQPFVNISNKKDLEKLKDLEKIDKQGYFKYFSSYIKSHHAKNDNLWKCFLQNL